MRVCCSSILLAAEHRWSDKREGCAHSTWQRTAWRSLALVEERSFDALGKLRGCRAAGLVLRSPRVSEGEKRMCPLRADVFGACEAAPSPSSSASSARSPISADAFLPPRERGMDLPPRAMSSMETARCRADATCVTECKNERPGERAVDAVVCASASSGL